MNAAEFNSVSQTEGFQSVSLRTLLKSFVSFSVSSVQILFSPIDKNDMQDNKVITQELIVVSGDGVILLLVHFGLAGLEFTKKMIYSSSLQLQQ